MVATSVNNNDLMNEQSEQSVFSDVRLFAVPGLEDETHVETTATIKNPGKPPQTPTPARPWSNLSMTASSFNRKTKTKTHSYKFIQLERGLISADLLKNNDDRTNFETEYLRALRDNTYDEFLQRYYQKIHDHYAQIKKERELKQSRVFASFDLEKTFLALDPTRDVKILFVDESSDTPGVKTANLRSTTSVHQRATSAAAASDAAVEAFYAKRSQLLLNNPSRARDEVTLFARRTAERLHERLPRLTSVPYRVKIVDERDTSGKPDERTLIQMKHKYALSLINKRRHVLMKMMTQTRKNQTKMEEQWTQPSFAIDGAACCRELLERANQIEQTVGQGQRRQRPQTAMISRRRPSKNISTPTASSDVTMTNTTIDTSVTSTSIPYQDALCLDHIEKTKHVRILLPTRPLTAPIKVNWKNYC